jgi:hypothetical protein
MKATRILAIAALFTAFSTGTGDAGRALRVKT